MKTQTATYQRENSRKRADWSSEITPPRRTDNGEALSVSDASSGAANPRREDMDATPSRGPQVVSGQDLSQLWPDIENNLPNDVIEAPTTMEEVYRGSMKALLLRNVGNYVVATFLIGTQTTVSWEGILYDVGNE